jgi:hypothetical protein
MCVPERGIMLTTFVYHIQLKKPKNQPLSPKGWFSALGEEIRVGYWMPHGVLGSLLN